MEALFKWAAGLLFGFAVWVYIKSPPFSASGITVLINAHFFAQGFFVQVFGAQLHGM
jgi:hypothetical protein